MNYLLQVDFPFQGPWGDKMAEAMKELAQSIAQEPGLIWKIWTENPEHNEAGGIYLFATEQQAQSYFEMHRKRLEAFGINSINGKIFAVNKALSLIDRAPL